MLVCSPPISWGVHNANCTAQDAALDSSSFVAVACAVENFEQTHSKITFQTPHVLCQTKRDGANALHFLFLVLIEV